MDSRNFLDAIRFFLLPPVALLPFSAAIFFSVGAAQAQSDERVAPTSVAPTATPATAAPAAKPPAAAAKPVAAKPVVKPLPPTPSATPYKQEASKKFPKVVSKLLVDDLQPGRGRAAKPGAKLVVHFTSWLYDPTQPLGRGPQFESTVGKSPYKFTLQNPETPHIPGWEQGFVDMKLGGRRRLIIPPDQAYGASGAGQVIPPNATLLYEIELLEVE